MSHLKKKHVVLTGTKAFRRCAELQTARVTMATEKQIRKLVGRGVNKKDALKLSYDQALRQIKQIDQKTKRAVDKDRKRLAQPATTKQIKRLQSLGVPAWKTDELTTTADAEAMIKKHQSLPPLSQQIAVLKALGIVSKRTLTRGEAASLIESRSH